jgi:hypothetical protein
MVELEWLNGRDGEMRDKVFSPKFLEDEELEAV